MKRTVYDLIAIHAAAQSGKTTAAEFLRKNGYAVLSFATPIRKMLMAMGVEEKYFTPEHKNTPIPEFGNKSCRYLMQTLGTDWGRDRIIQSLWIDILCNTPEYKAYRRGETKLVIDDLRFENEARFVRCLVGSVICIERKTTPKQNGIDGHVSELGIPSHLITQYVRNTGTIKEFLNNLAYLTGISPKQEDLPLT